MGKQTRAAMALQMNLEMTPEIMATISSDNLLLLTVNEAGDLEVREVTVSSYLDSLRELGAETDGGLPQLAAYAAATRTCVAFAAHDDDGGAWGLIARTKGVDPKPGFEAWARGGAS